MPQDNKGVEPQGPRHCYCLSPEGLFPHSLNYHLCSPAPTAIWHARYSLLQLLVVCLSHQRISSLRAGSWVILPRLCLCPRTKEAPNMRSLTRVFKENGING